MSGVFCLFVFLWWGCLIYSIVSMKNGFIVWSHFYAIPLRNKKATIFTLLERLVKLFRVHQSSGNNREYSPYRWGLEYTKWIPSKKKSCVLDMTLNCIWWWVSSSRALGMWSTLNCYHSQVHFNMKLLYLLGSHVWVKYIYLKIAQSVRAIQYADCISTRGYDRPQRMSRIWH